MIVSTKDTESGVMRGAEPHRRLMAAVLQTVLDDCRGTAYKREAEYQPLTALRGARQAIAYVSSTDRAWPFSFENLCEALGMDARCFRQELWKGDAVASADAAAQTKPLPSRPDGAY